MEHRSWLAHPFGPFSCVRMRHACDRAIAAEIKKGREREREREREEGKRGREGGRTCARARVLARAGTREQARGRGVNQRDIFPQRGKPDGDVKTKKQIG